MAENANTLKKGDFVELKYTGSANGEIFDSNIEEDLKELNPKAAEKPHKTVITIGESMVIAGLDKALEGKELGKQYEIDIPKSEAFGERKRNLIRTLPLSSFTEQRIMPRPGMMLTLDNYLVKIIAVSGARVIADFNNPLAGKDIKYKFTVTRKVTDDRERAEAFFDFFLRYVPEFEVKETSVVAKGPKQFEMFLNAYKEKFKELIGKDLVFEEQKPKAEDKKDNSEEKAE